MKKTTIPNFSNYTITECGRVYNKNTNVEVSQVLSGVPQYYYVNVYNDKRERKLKRVHTLVAITYIPNPDNKDYVDHIDQDKLNNHTSNLRWVTREENSRNMKSNVYITLGGEVQVLKDYCINRNEYVYYFRWLKDLDTYEFESKELMDLIIEEHKELRKERRKTIAERESKRLKELKCKEDLSELKEKYLSSSIKYHDTHFISIRELYDYLKISHVSYESFLCKYRGSTSLEEIESTQRVEVKDGKTIKELHEESGVSWGLEVTKSRYQNMTNSKRKSKVTWDNIFTSKPRIRKYVYNGEKYSRKALCDLLEINNKTISKYTNFSYTLRDYCRDRNIFGWENIYPIFLKV